MLALQLGLLDGAGRALQSYLTRPLQRELRELRLLLRGLGFLFALFVVAVFPFFPRLLITVLYRRLLP